MKRRVCEEGTVSREGLRGVREDDDDVFVKEAVSRVREEAVSGIPEGVQPCAMGGHEAHQKRRKGKEVSSMWDRFGYVGVVCFTGYKDRIPALRSELERVGLLDMAVFHWDFPNMFKDRLAERLPLLTHDRKRSFPIGYNNYRVVKTAYHLGCGSVLVLEDDARFLKDVASIGSALEMLPQDYDLAMLDKNWEGGRKDHERWMRQPDSMKASKAWIRFDSMFSTGCYAMSRRGMERWMAAYERGANNTRNGMMNGDEYFSRVQLGADAHLYAAVPSLAVQVVRGEHELSGYWRLLEESGTKRKDYAE